MSGLFGELSTPDAFKELLDTLTLAEGAKPFGKFVDRLDLPWPKPERCFWLRQLIEQIVRTPTGLVEECRVRGKLTWGEYLKYLQILRKHGRLVPIGRPSPPLPPISDARGVLLKGAFLDDLKADGLTDCEYVQTYDISTQWVFGPYERVCV